METFKKCVDCKEKFPMIGFFTENGEYSDACNVCRIPWLKEMHEKHTQTHKGKCNDVKNKQSNDNDNDKKRRVQQLLINDLDDLEDYVNAKLTAAWVQSHEQASDEFFHYARKMGLTRQEVLEQSREVYKHGDDLFKKKKEEIMTEYSTLRREMFDKT